MRAGGEVAETVSFLLCFGVRCWMDGWMDGKRSWRCVHAADEWVGVREG